MTQDRNIYLGGCDVEWINATVNSSGVVFDGDDAIVMSVYESDLDVDDDNGAVISGADGLSLSYISAGKFVGHLATGIAFTRDAFYWLEVTATPDGGTAHTRRMLVQAVDRGPNP